MSVGLTPPREPRGLVSLRGSCSSSHSSYQNGQDCVEDRDASRYKIVVAPDTGILARVNQVGAHLVNDFHQRSEALDIVTGEIPEHGNLLRCLLAKLRMTRLESHVARGGA